MERDYTGFGFEYIVNKKYRDSLCFGSKMHRELLPRRGPGLTGFMRRIGAEHPMISPDRLGDPLTMKKGKMTTIPKSPRWTVTKIYQPPPRVPSPPPDRKKTPHIPFNSSTKQRPKPKKDQIPGPGLYNPSTKKKRMKFNHSFGGDTIIVPAVDIKCVPYNDDVCIMCGCLCTDQGDYWYNENRTFLCRACYQQEHLTHSKYNKMQLEDFKPIRDCFFAHHHEMYQNSIKLLGKKEIRKRIYKEAYLSQFFSNIRDYKFTTGLNS